jgi:hypothetical protein
MVKEAIREIQLKDKTSGKNFIKDMLISIRWK